MRLLAMVAALTLAVSAPVACAVARRLRVPAVPGRQRLACRGVASAGAPRSGAYLAAMGSGAGLHADFGSGTWEGGPIGIPYTVVPAGQARVPVRFGPPAE